MALKKAVFQNRGMNKDLSISKVNNEFVYHNFNIRITAEDKETLFTVTNEKGNKVIDILSYDGSGFLGIQGALLGYSVLNNYLILFFTGYTNSIKTDSIYRIEFKDNKWYGKLLIEDDLNFSEEHPIETLANYESEDVQKIYWVDGINQPRFINISDRYLEEHPTIDKDFLNFVSSISSFLTIDVEKVFNKGGIFPSGIIQYVATYSNKYGQETNICGVSRELYISPSDRGASPDETVNIQFKLNIQNVDTRYEFINIYSIIRTSESGEYSVSKVAEYSINGDNVEIIDLNSNSIPEESSSLLYKGGQKIKAYTLEAKDNHLFLGNITTEEFIVPEVNSILEEARSGPENNYSSTYLRFVPKDKVVEKSNGVYDYIPVLDSSREEVTTFKRGELYRIGIRLYNEYGNKSGVYWVGDIISDEITSKMRDNNILTTYKLEFNFAEFKKKYFESTGKTLYAAELMMANPSISDRLILAQGYINPTMFNVQQRIENTPFAINSWFIRPYSNYGDGATIPGKKVSGHYQPLLPNYTLSAELQCVKDFKDEGPFNYRLASEVSTAYRICKFIISSRCKYEYNPSLWKYNFKFKCIEISNTGAVSTIEETYYNEVISPNTLEQWQTFVKENLQSFSGEFNYTDAYIFRSAANRLNVKYNSEAEQPFNDVDGVIFDFYESQREDSQDYQLAENDYRRYTYYTDESILSFYSPEVNEDTYKVFDKESYNIKYVGVAFSNTNITEYTINIDNVNTGTVNKYFNFNNIVENTPLITFPLIETNSPFKYSYDNTWEGSNEMDRSIRYIYPWHKNGELSRYNEGKDIIKSKTFANCNYFNKTLYMEEASLERLAEPLLDIRAIHEGGLYDLKTVWGKKYYQGDYDYTLAIPMTEDNENSYFQYVYPSNEGTLKSLMYSNLLTKYTNAEEVPRDSTDYGNITDEEYNNSIRIQYKSSPHLVIARNTKQSLPKISGSGLHRAYPEGEFLSSAILNNSRYWDPVFSYTMKMDVYGAKSETEEAIIPSNNKYIFTAPWDRNSIITFDTPAANMYGVSPYEGDEKFLMEDALIIAEIYKQYDPNAAYGGATEDAIKKNNFISIGNISSEDLLYGYGDTYFQRWDYLNVYQSNSESGNNISESTSVLLETHINLDYNTSNRRGTLNILGNTKDNTNIFNPVYNDSINYFSGVALDEKFSLNKFSNQIIWSKQKFSNENTDSWLNYSLASYLELDGNKGSISSIKRFRNNIIAFQERGISEILFNSRTQISTTSGIPIEIANSQKVDGKRYIDEKVGCQNKWSIVETSNGIYFIDNFSGSINLFNGQSIVSLSDSKGFGTYMKDNNSTSIWNPRYFNNFVTYWDRINDDVYFVNNNNTENVLCFNEKLQEFTSFYQYGAVPMMVNIADKFIAFKGNALWEQGAGYYNIIFGEAQPYYVTYKVTPDRYSDKVFTNIEYRADIFDNDDNLTNDTFDIIRVNNEYQDTGDVYIPTINKKYPSVKEKFRIWRMDIPRALKGGKPSLDRIRNPWVNITLRKDVSSINRIELHDLIVQYID